MFSIKIISTIVFAAVLICLAAGSSFAQDAEADGWHYIKTTRAVDWYYKAEKPAVRIRWDRKYYRHYGARSVFSDLTIKYAYAFTRDDAKPSRWTTATVTISRWRELSKYIDKPPAPHTVVKTIHVRQRSKSMAFCVRTISLREANKPVSVDPDELAAVCSPITP